MRGGMLGRHSRGKIAVDLYDGEPPDAFEQWARQCAQAGADLDEIVIRPRVERCHDALDVMAVDQEMLAETLACDEAAAMRPSRG